MLHLRDEDDENNAQALESDKQRLPVSGKVAGQDASKTKSNKDLQKVCDKGRGTGQKRKTTALESRKVIDTN